MATHTSLGEVQRVVDHIFLPPKLPQCADDASEAALVRATLEALVALRALLLPHSPLAAIDNAITLITNLRAANGLPCGSVDQTQVEGILKSLERGGSVAVKVSAQNAAVLITRFPDAVVFEEFELSPQDEAVVLAKGRLTRTFPGLAVAVDAGLLDHSGFSSMVADTLSTMSRQQAPGMQPQTKKAGAMHDEHRDTTHPAIISELLMGMLRGIGAPTDVSVVSKNTRDEVLYHNAAAPWRRSPMWLLIRVALQLVISRSFDGSDRLYKEVMVFILSQVLRSAADLPPDTLYAMKAKIHRRLQKLSVDENPVLPVKVTESIDNILQQVSDSISASWARAQQYDSRGLPLSALDTLMFEEDVIVSLPAMDSYIETTLSRQSDNSSSRFTPSSQLIRNAPGSLPSLPTSNSKNSFYAAANLLQFEQWVAQHIDIWVATCALDNACGQVHQLMKQYYNLARDFYAGNPEATSVMVLTIFELWVACDKIAIRSSSLISEFDPGIPPTALQNLLLPFLDQMKRLLTVEKYLESRQAKSTESTDRLFDTKSNESFANKYFDKSGEYKELLLEIESDAFVARQAKKAEFDRLKAEYDRLNALYDGTDCQYKTEIFKSSHGPPQTREVHKNSCEKCNYRVQRDKLSIDVHEWPLPSDPCEAKTIVFELQVPVWFAHWRDARFDLVHDVLVVERTEIDLAARYLLSSNDPHLTQTHFERSFPCRIELLSQSKPVVSSHYHRKDIATVKESEIYISNGLRYQYYDATSEIYVGPLTFDDSVPKACTYRLPCEDLQRFIHRPASTPDGPQPNTVFAGLDTCPANMTLEEFKDLTTIPLGCRIQWPNILLQLAMPSVDLKKPETTLVLLQCIYQAGPPGSSVLRESHEMFNHEERASSLLRVLTEALDRVKGNWESSQALHTFVAIAARALSLSASNAVQCDCLAFLASARNVAMDWVNHLREKAYSAEDHNDRNTFISKGVEAALICASTFDVDEFHLYGVLAVPNNSSTLIQCSIVIQEGEQSQSPGREQDLLLLDMRFKRLLYRVYKILPHYSSELDDAVRRLWSAYRPGAAGWDTVSETTNDWLTTDTADVQGTSSTVHYNLLTGELLVNGLPLDRPPKSFSCHALYSTLFGQAIVEVMPSTTRGFQFSAKRAFHGLNVQLGMVGETKDHSGDLIVQATDEANVYETIPSRLLEAAYPHHFRHGYVHWFHAATNTVLFTPVDDPWNMSSSSKWTLNKYPQPKKWRLTNGGCFVIGKASPTSNRTFCVLAPLANFDSINITLQASGETVHIDVPPLRLGFSLTRGSRLLESREFRSMAVDDDQSLGTLVGLQSRIVLKSLKGGKRVVLLPESTNIDYSRKNDHVSVEVHKDSILKVHALHIDPLLGRLLDNGDLGCKLYLAYLHALTSFCLVDPLTYKTGTEQALTILKCAAVRSFHHLSPANIDILNKLANLSPRRCYYPRHKCVMQTVDWDDRISFLSQHGHLISAVRELFQQAAQNKIFYPDDRLKLPRLDHVDEHLLQRDNVRSATFRGSGYGAEDHSVQGDQEYAARDRDILAERAIRASAMSNLIFRDDIRLSDPALASGSLWQSLCRFQQITGPGQATVHQKVQYDASLLQGGEDFLAQRFLSFHRWLSTSINSPKIQFSVMAWLSTLAFAPEADMPFLQAVAMFYKSSALAQINPPDKDSFRPLEGTDCARNKVKVLIEENRRKFDACPEYNEARRANETWNQYSARRHTKWQSSSNTAVSALVDAVANQWPCEYPRISANQLLSTYIKLSGAKKALDLQFKMWSDNASLDRYLTRVEQTLSALGVQEVQVPTLWMSAPCVRHSIRGYVSERDIFVTPVPELPREYYDLELPIRRRTSGRVRETLLSSVVDRLSASSSQSEYGKQYAASLGESLGALLARADGTPDAVDVTPDSLSYHLYRCNDRVQKMYEILLAAVRPLTTKTGRGAEHHSPRLSPTLFLQQLTRSRWACLPEGWKVCIVDYGLALAARQRAERLIALCDPSRKEELFRELCNSGHQNWNPMENPEYLLMEVESGILIREVQVQIAAQMRDPPEGKNAVMQLNMGEGKSSVIVPMVAAALADGNQLTRVIVAKPQSKQMAQMLISKLGGLLGRRIYYMPITRSNKLDIAAAIQISDMLHECRVSGGILLLQPEHILSYQLMAPESYIADNERVGQELMSTLDVLDRNSRDIVDESDENFSVRFELVYTMGLQRSTELSPDRWLLLQQVLNVVKLLAPAVANELPLSLEYHPGVPGSFPRVRILRPNAEALLLDRLAKYICENGLDGFHVSRQPAEVRKAVMLYISKYQLTAAEISAVESSPFWTEVMKPRLLLIRGIIACGVLQFALSQKRWRVNYGLAPRTPPTRLAVPYRAKDSPSPRSEFSHPDVVITLTSLAYYYGGLCDSDLFIAMGHLMESDQSDIEYQAWVRDARHLPAAFRQLQGINLKDRLQCTSEIFPALRYSKRVIDYFLSQIVFPTEMKEFPHKLSASGWDLGKTKALPVTGFSGTNDSRYLLPVSVDHLDIPEQKHTNALVMEHILQPTNEVELMGPAPQHMSDAEHLLSTVLGLSPPVQVILDVGAQILELDNFEVAKKWLSMHDQTKQAAVFLDEHDDLCVVDRNDRVDPLQTSSFFNRLDSCLIFLDEAHTRGIDLQLPVDYRAAVTLGAKLTKDRLVQACMRMRKLGKGQSVVFCIPTEIQDQIAERTAGVYKPCITVADVLLWSISETYAEMRHSMPLWAVQGERFFRHEKVWKKFCHEGRPILSKAQAQKLEDDEAQTIYDRYRPLWNQTRPFYLTSCQVPGLRSIAERCELFNDLEITSSTLEEEQERELSPETEQERQIQKAPPASPVLHRLHQDVRSFAATGVLVSHSDAYMPAFEALRDCSAAEGFPVAQLAGDHKLFVTADFCETVELQASDISDMFQRPVQWLLTSRAKGTNSVGCIVILSPFEANALYKSMDSYTASALHVYKPRCNSRYASLDHLNLHTVSAAAVPPYVPRALAIQLNLFAGQLYINSFVDYQEICKFLGLSTEALTKEMDEQGWKVAADGFIFSDEQGRVGGRSGVTQSPTNFFKILLSKIRRNGDGITKTHMGGLLEGKLFNASDFESRGG